MIDLTKFSEQDLKLIEELIDSKIKTIYRLNEKFEFNLPSSNPEPYILLKAKIINQKRL